MNNLLKYIDPTGMWIYLYYGGSSYRYDDGKLYERGDFSWKAESSLVKKEIKGISVGKVSVNSMNANSIRGEAIYNYSPIITFSWGFKKINKSIGSLSS